MENLRSEIRQTIGRVYDTKFPTLREIKDIERATDILTELFNKLHSEQLPKADVSGSKTAIREVQEGQLFSCSGRNYIIKNVEQATDKGNLENGQNIFTIYK